MVYCNLQYTKYTRPIAYSIWDMDFDHQNLTLFIDPWNEVEIKWKLSDGHEELARYAHTKYSYPITLNKREINITKKSPLFCKLSLNHENEVKDNRCVTEETL